MKCVSKGLQVKVQQYTFNYKVTAYNFSMLVDNINLQTEEAQQTVSRINIIKPHLSPSQSNHWKPEISRKSQQQPQEHSIPSHSDSHNELKKWSLQQAEVSKVIVELNNISQIHLTSTDSMEQQRDTYFSQAHTGHSPREDTVWVKDTPLHI